VTWFRRLRDDAREEAKQAVGPDPEDRPEALAGRLGELVRFVNSSAGRLPGEAVVIARATTDLLREIVVGALPIDPAPSSPLPAPGSAVGADAERDLDVYTVVSIRGILEDYLPTTLRSYLALDPDVVDVPSASGRTPSESLIEQLDALWSAAGELRDAAHAHDADALLAQGSFLRTKFTGSDLDL
jgi:hypothetical protein